MPAGIKGNHNIKYIIAGLPRSGTGFMSQLLTSAGVPIGHEMFFGMPGHGFYPKNAVGDSSWMSVPFLQNFAATIIHLVRDPMENISSLMHRNTFSEEKSIFTAYKMYRLPSLENYKEIDKYLHFYIEWNKQIERMANLRVKLEDVTADPAEFLKELQIDVIGKELNTNPSNASIRPTSNLTLKNFKDCDQDLLKEFIRLANLYGYDLK
jgi:hypothetical protein